MNHHRHVSGEEEFPMTLASFYIVSSFTLFSHTSFQSTVYSLVLLDEFGLYLPSLDKVRYAQSHIFRKNRPSTSSSPTVTAVVISIGTTPSTRRISSSVFFVR